VAAVAALILPTNSDRSLVARYAALTALVHQLATSAGKDRLDLNPPTFGAAAFRRRPLVSIGGFLDSAVAEDLEVTLALTRAGWRTRFVPGAVAENCVVETLGEYWRQHLRWTHGGMAALNRRPLSQEAPLARRVEGLLTAAGDADRVVFALAAILAVPGMVPVWVPAAYLVFPALEIAAALARAGALRSLHRFLLAAAVVFPVDIAASSAGMTLKVLGRAPRWTSPGRTVPSADGR
jgi:cellulose synthase/poly-beta-1,6-N-acetylglucosamine synthase-like glycosyltransferase